MGSPSLEWHRPTDFAAPENEAGDNSRAFQQGPRATRTDAVIIAGFGDAVAADYAAFVARTSQSTTVIVVADEKVRRLVEPPVRSVPLDELLSTDTDIERERGQARSVILFVNACLSGRKRRELDDFLRIARRWQIGFVGIITTFRLHLDDPRVAQAENEAVARASGLSARVVVFRPGHVLSRHSFMSRFLECAAPFYALFPDRLSSCFIEGTELFAAIEAKRLEETCRATHPGPWTSAAKPPPLPQAASRAVAGKGRAYALLGPNQSWRALLLRHQPARPRRSVMAAVGTLLSWLLVGQFFAIIVALLARCFPWWRQWTVHTLKPHSMRELIALCHQGNIDHVKVVGYNNGVVHFGHRHAGKTIISTVRCRRTARSGSHKLKADCGATVRGALDYLARNGEELYVVPNYSYVCLGTSFFVPIHGSAVDYSTLADTICKVVLYDPDSDRLISASRNATQFGEHVYNLQSRIVVLRLYVLTKPKASYFVRRTTLEGPSADDVLAALRDVRATNVEIRQSHAASTKVKVARYYKEIGEASSPTLELPRDALGGLWDRLEENPVTSFLMHSLSKRLAWHTELFFTPSEFDLFWQTCRTLPLRKIQLRYLRRDGLPHSPCRDDDRVSADLFLFRRNKARFLGYLKNTFPDVRTNPGKHSG